MILKSIKAIIAFLYYTKFILQLFDIHTVFGL